MTVTMSFYPLGLSETDAVSLDTFLSRQPNAAQLYLSFLTVHPARSLEGLARRKYFIRKDGLLAVYDPESTLKGGWDFFDPKTLNWTRDLDLAEPQKVWGKASPMVRPAPAPVRPASVKPDAVPAPAVTDDAVSALASLDQGNLHKVLGQLGQTAAAIVSATGLDKLEVAAILRQLKAAGEVHTDGQGNQTRWVRRRGRPRTRLAGLTGAKRYVKRTAAKPMSGVAKPLVAAPTAPRMSPPERVLKALTDGTGLTIGEIALHATVKKPAVAEILRGLRETGQVATTGQRRGTRYHRVDGVDGALGAPGMDGATLGDGDADALQAAG